MISTNTQIDEKKPTNDQLRSLTNKTQLSHKKHYTATLTLLNNKNHYFINKICILLKFYSIFKFILLESNELNFVLT